MSELAPLEDELDRLLIGVAGDARARLARAIATDLRRAQAARIRANVTPEGAPMVPRKPREGAAPKTGRAKPARMFQRATGTKHLRTKVTPAEILVGYAGAAARVLRPHQLGLRDRVSSEPGSPEVTYPERPLIGLTPDDRRRVMEKVLSLWSES